MMSPPGGWPPGTSPRWATGSSCTCPAPRSAPACCGCSASRRRRRRPGGGPRRVLVAPSPVLESREAVVTAYLRDAQPPLAMVAYDDLSAVAALRAAHQAGWLAPDDLSVVGIDDIQFAASPTPGLTTVAQPKQELGALAVDALLAPAAAGPQARVLNGRLVIRESTMPPAGPGPGPGAG